MEEWKDIAGYEGIYQASNLGRIKSLDRVIQRKNGVTLPLASRIISPGVSSNGYLVCSLTKEGIHKSYTVHKLIALTFISSSYLSEGLEVNHKDSDRANPALNNLELVNRSGNMKHCIAKGRNNPNPVKGSKHRWSKLVEEDVKFLRNIVWCSSWKYLAESYGIKYETLYHLINNNKTWRGVI